jgi:Helix-turn-helix domain
MKTSASNSTQCQRIFDWLRHKGALSTLQARQQLDVLHPGARVQELRELLRAEGCEIAMTFGVDFTEQGTPHRVAQYRLVGEPKQRELF